MKVLKSLLVAIAVAAGMLIVPAQPANAVYCPPPPADSGGVTQGDYNPSGIGQVDPRYTVPQYLEWVVRDADEMWSSWFRNNGMCEPEVGYNLVGYTSVEHKSKCTLNGKKMVVHAAYPNAFYCGLDVTLGANGHSYVGTVILPVTTFKKMWYGNIFGKNSGTAGDFGAGGIVAHEFGHHVQDELSKQLGWKPPTGKRNELLADCFAGIWTWRISQGGVLEYGDLDEIVAALNVIGDAKVTDNDHGTAAERIEALGIGYNSGFPMQCVNAYWR